MSDHSWVSEARRASIELDVHDTIRHGIQHKRDEAIRNAHAEGVTIAELARTTDLSRTIIYRILDQE